MLMLLLDNVSQVELAYKQTALETYKEAKLPIGSFVDWDILRNEGEMILGYDDVKEDMRKTAEEFVRAMSKGRTWGHAVLFTGPPGTGKTALAHYFAYLVYEEGKKAGIEFKAVRVEAKDLLTAYWGETERRINELFAWASMNNGIIIMDEVERIAWARTQYVSDDYTPKVVATLGDALDNPLVRDKPFLLLMTTNMPQLIDAMFKRPGRVFRVFNIGEMDDVRKEAVVRAFEERYGITLSPKERRELKELIIVGDDARFYFECRLNEGSHERCIDYIRSVAELRKQTQQTLMVF
jgi:SpoVK/Ycf46/Vps4 family AAA+-type ATPase